MGGRGSGWHGERKRHSDAATRGARVNRSPLKTATKSALGYAERKLNPEGEPVVFTQRMAKKGGEVRIWDAELTDAGRGSTGANTVAEGRKFPLKAISTGTDYFTVLDWDNEFVLLAETGERRRVDEDRYLMRRNLFEMWAEPTWERKQAD